MATATAMTGLKRIFRSGFTMVPESNNIHIGDRFEQLKQGLPIWIVERVKNIEGCSSPLVSMHREDMPDVKKTLSHSALDDHDDFKPYAS